MESSQSNVALTEGQVADRLGISAAVLRAWRLSGRGPRFCRFGRAVRYLEEDIEHFKAESKVDPRREQSRSA